MHHHCEIIMPQTGAVESAIAKILAPFSEHEDESADRAFWDWYVIGGRWAGAHEEAKLDPATLDAFNARLTAERVMIKGFICGKEELADGATAELVDAIWREMFPGAGERCPLFQHGSPSQYENSLADVCQLDAIDPSLTAARVIIAAPNYRNELAAVYMCATTHWNGVNSEKTAWDGRVLSAVDAATKAAENYRDEYREKVTPRPDWLAVTVDYHS